MRRFQLLTLSILGLMVFGNLFLIGNLQAASPEEMLNKIQWLGQASVKIEGGGKIIYVDPVFNINETHDADIILVTHPHPDHFSIQKVQQLAKDDTVIIGPKGICNTVQRRIKNKTIIAEPGLKTSIDGIDIEAVHAYNVVKTQYHPKESKFVGYVLTVDGVRIYHAGDTERIPEMKNFTCDIAILPLGQTYTMNSVEG